MAESPIKQDDTDLSIAMMHAIGFSALIAGLRLILVGSPGVGRLIVSMVLMVLAYFLFIRDVKRMTLRSFGLMFFCVAFIGILRGLRHSKRTFPILNTPRHSKRDLHFHFGWSDLPVRGQLLFLAILQAE